ncbi:MAG: putative lipid II flippase FtsW [bacterium]
MALRRSQIKTGQNRGGSGKVDYVMLFLILGLTLFGLVMVSSASVVMSKTGIGEENHYLFSQLASGFIGLVAMFIAAKIDYQVWKKVAPLMFIGSIVILLLVFVPGLKFSHNGASRWINIFGIQFQPSELMKISMIIFLASWLEKRKNEIGDFQKVVVPFAGIVILVLGLILIEPDMGTATVLALTAGVMFFVAGSKMSHVFAAVGTAIGGVIVLIAAAPYRMARFTIFLNPTADKSGSGYQISQALVAIGSGGLFGLGFGRSRQKFNYLPEAATDSIFAVIAEELGLIISCAIVFVFLLFGLRGYKISRGAPDMFSRLVATGITTWIISQAFINILAILSLMPLTGVPLPFFSYGGTSLMMILASCGILLNISKSANQGGSDENNSIGRWNWRTYFPSFSSNRRITKKR